MNPLFSVIVPVRDGAPFLEACFASIVAQADVPLEIVVSDDGSHDDSMAIAESWRDRHPGQFRVLEPPSAATGIATNYARATLAARAPYLAFLEQDDAWPAGYLARKAGMLEDIRVGVVYSPYAVVSERLYGIDMRIRQVLLAASRPQDRAFDNFDALCWHNNIATFSAFVCRRDLWNAVPPPQPRDTPYVDWWYLAHLAQESLFRFDDGPPVRWRCAPSTRLGSQGFREHQLAVAAFIPSLHESLDLRARENAARRAVDARTLEASPALLDLLVQPGVRTFGAALRAAPLWATQMLVSLGINRIKKRSALAPPG